MYGNRLQDSLGASFTQLTYREWETRRKILWEGHPEIKDTATKVVTQEAIKGMRSIISQAWSDTLSRMSNGDSLASNGYSIDNSHFGVLEIGNIHLDIDKIQERLRHIGITRENCPDFDEYCSHLEVRPEKNTSKNGPGDITHSSVEARNVQSRTSRRVFIVSLGIGTAWYGVWKGTRKK